MVPPWHQRDDIIKTRFDVFLMFLLITSLLRPLSSSGAKKKKKFKDIISMTSICTVLVPTDSKICFFFFLRPHTENRGEYLGCSFFKSRNWFGDGKGQIPVVQTLISENRSETVQTFRYGAPDRFNIIIMCLNTRRLETYFVEWVLFNDCDECY